MLYLLSKIFVQKFYSANAGFFLFFFFIFFGAVQGSSLISYHLSLMNSILGSGVTLSIVFFCWALYHWKCVNFFLKTINSEEGKFLYSLQVMKKSKQWLLYSVAYIAVYAPILIYAVVLSITGFQKGYGGNATLILVFQPLSIVASLTIIFFRLNNWIYNTYFPSFAFGSKKSFLFLNFYYFLIEKKSLLLIIKTLSLSLLYIVLVWNKGRYDNDSFMLFYLVILMIHAVFPFLAVEFLEEKLAVYRNLPVSLFKRILLYILPYFIFFLPEFAYILYHADAFPFENRLAYCINTMATLFLLTAFLYSEGSERDEYLKASGGLIFFSIFALHIQAFWVWISIQLLIGLILFISGYYKYENAE